MLRRRLIDDEISEDESIDSYSTNEKYDRERNFTIKTRNLLFFSIYCHILVSEKETYAGESVWKCPWEDVFEE